MSRKFLVGNKHWNTNSPWCRPHVCARAVNWPLYHPCIRKASKNEVERLTRGKNGYIAFCFSSHFYVGSAHHVTKCVLVLNISSVAKSEEMRTHSLPQIWPKARLTYSSQSLSLSLSFYNTKIGEIRGINGILFRPHSAANKRLCLSSTHHSLSKRWRDPCNFCCSAQWESTDEWRGCQMVDFLSSKYITVLILSK